MVIAVLSSGDTAWMLMSTALVMLMTIPGLALFYGGLVKKETVLNTLFLSFSAYAVVSIIWFIYGYPLVFGPDVHGFIGAPGDFFFHNVVGELKCDRFIRSHTIMKWQRDRSCFKIDHVIWVFPFRHFIFE